MSETKIEDLNDGSLPQTHLEHEYSGCESDWLDIVMIKIGEYTIEYDPEDKTLTITGGTLIDVDCIDDTLIVGEFPECRTIVVRSSSD